jgi:hypothetical protein
MISAAIPFKPSAALSARSGKSSASFGADSASMSVATVIIKVE